MGQEISHCFGWFHPKEQTTSPYLPLPPRVAFLLEFPECSLKTKLRHAWNDCDRSPMIRVKQFDKMTFYRYPAINSTDCIRGRIGYSRGLNVWEIRWSISQRGTHAVIGVATSEASLHSARYCSLVGSNAESWGWDIVNNKLCHDTVRNGPGLNYPSVMQNAIVAPECILVILDMDRGTLGFAVDRCYLGIAFGNLKGKTLYPIVSTVWGHCEVTMIYRGGLDPEPESLQALCRHVIRQKIGEQQFSRMKEVDLPKMLKTYVVSS